MEPNYETSSVVGDANDYAKAKTVPVSQNNTSAAVSQKGRVVVTKRNQGTVQLRYAPHDPKPESPDTSS